MEIRSQLPSSDIKSIVEAVEAKTDEPIIYVEDGEFGPEVRTGRLYGHIWIVRLAPSGWRVLHGHQWAT